MADIDTFYNIYGRLDRGQWRHDAKADTKEVPVSEASEVQKVPESRREIARIAAQVFNAQPEHIWDGIHGVILDYRHPGANTGRMVKAKLAKLVNHKQFRWMESDRDGITIGC